MGGLGRLLVGARAAVARLASNKVALDVSATVSVTTVGAGVVGGTTALGPSTFSSVVTCTIRRNGRITPQVLDQAAQFIHILRWELSEILVEPLHRSR